MPVSPESAPADTLPAPAADAHPEQQVPARSQAEMLLQSGASQPSQQQQQQQLLMLSQLDYVQPTQVPDTLLQLDMSQLLDGSVSDLPQVMQSVPPSAASEPAAADPCSSHVNGSPAQAAHGLQHGLSHQSQQPDEPAAAEEPMTHRQIPSGSPARSVAKHLQPLEPGVASGFQVRLAVACSLSPRSLQTAEPPASAAAAAGSMQPAASPQQVPSPLPNLCPAA